MMAEYFVEGFDLNKKKATNILFLAEGLPEVGFLEAALKLRKASADTTTILCFRGIDKMGRHANTIVKFIDPQTVQALQGVGIIADSENSPKGRIDSVIECAKSFLFPKCAADLKVTGRHTDGNRKFAVSLSPALDQQGRIETLILQEISPKETMKCICASFECISKANNGRDVDDKAKVQMYISAVMNNSMAGIRQGFSGGLFSVVDKAYSAHLAMVDFILA
jgi:hypothetical protein